MTHRRRYRWIILTVVVCLVAIGGAFAAGTMVRSGSERAAANSRTIPTVTATVEEHTIQPQPFQTTGKLSLGTTWDATLPAITGADPIVTATHLAAGTTLTSGTRIANVAGRPAIALTMSFAPYRDIHGGDTGDDVAAIQRALADLGLYGGEVDGEYGAGTAGAVTLLYEQVGAEAPLAKKGSEESGTSAEPTTQPSVAPTPTPEQKRARELAALTPVPRSEIISLPTFTASVVQVAEVGSLLGTDNPLVKLRSGEPSVTIRVGMADLGRVPQGQQVEVSAATDTTSATTGRVESVSDFKGADGDGSIPGYDVTIVVPAPGDLAEGADVVVRVAATEAGTTGLAVPVTALREEAGATYVLVPGKDAKGNETQTRVPVTVSEVADGFAILAGGELAAGDLVIVTVGP
ncbi:MAG: peptidoglycan-binding protein [Ancrocorticia sp.]